MSPVKIFVVLFMMLCVPKVYASDSLAKYPRAVLVQLRSEHNRIQAMTRARDYKALEEVKRDAEEVRKKMILDFTSNFTYCPVYYYIDTNADLVKEKKFDGILLNPDGNPAINPVINSNSDDYFVVYYGYFIYQPNPRGIVTDSNKYVTDPEAPPGKGLVILNDKFQQLDYYYKLGYDEGFFRIRKKKLKEHYYVSKHYDIEYFPFAKQFQANWGDGFGRRRINPKLSKQQ